MLKGGVLKCEVQGSCRRVLRVWRKPSANRKLRLRLPRLSVASHLTCTAVAPQSTLFDIVDGDTMILAERQAVITSVYCIRSKTCL